MKALVRGLVLAVLATALFSVVQHRQIKAARSELARLEANKPASTPAELTGPTASAEEIARLRAENRDIHKLRGQISEMREKRRAVERMEAENGELREKIAHIQANPNDAATGPLPFSNKGQATPEATVETTFWSMYHGDVEGLARSMPAMAAEYDKMPATEKTNSLNLLRAMAATISNLEVLERKPSLTDEVHLTVRITRRDGMEFRHGSSPDQSTFVLRRTNDLWQIVGER